MLMDAEPARNLPGSLAVVDMGINVLISGVVGWNMH
jgi:hypothetical protein